MAEVSVEDYFGSFGGQFVAETLVGPLEQLQEAYASITPLPEFQSQLSFLMKNYVGRPTPITELRDEHGGKILLKREDLCHTGAHKINNALAQGLLAKFMGKKRIVAETGAGQHGVATATACALLGLECIIYMGATDAVRQKPNADRMRLLGADLRLVENGSKTLKDAITEAIRDWITNVANTHYLIGSAIGPAPFPNIVKEFQSIIGYEAKQQVEKSFQRLPHTVVACVGGGSNAIGIFSAFLELDQVNIVGVQAAGEGLNSNKSAAPLITGRPGILHGTLTMVNQNDDGQIQESHSLAPGLDYPGVGPEHAFLKESGRATYETITNQEALCAFSRLTREQGILPALESSHAVAYAYKLARNLHQDDIILVNLSGRGDKDLDAAMRAIEEN